MSVRRLTAAEHAADAVIALFSQQGVTFRVVSVETFNPGFVQMVLEHHADTQTRVQLTLQGRRDPEPNPEPEGS